MILKNDQKTSSKIIQIFGRKMPIWDDMDSTLQCLCFETHERQLKDIPFTSRVFTEELEPPKAITLAQRSQSRCVHHPKTFANFGSNKTVFQKNIEKSEIILKSKRNPELYMKFWVQKLIERMHTLRKELSLYRSGGR